MEQRLACQSSGKQPHRRYKSMQQVATEFYSIGNDINILCNESWR
jgi:hypothetical protein